MNMSARYSLPRLGALIIALLGVISGMTNSSVALAADRLSALRQHCGRRAG